MVSKVDVNLQPVVFNGLVVYRERGAFLRRLEQHEKAKVAYDEAYKFDPNNVRMLIGRSQVCKDAVEPDQAFEAAALALQLEPNNMVAKNTQAEAMYTISAFEQSIVMNYQGARARKQPPYFTDGICQGVRTVEDCIGKSAGPVMLEFLPIIKRMEKKIAGELEPELNERVSRMPKTKVKEKMTQGETRKFNTLSRVMAMKYLGPMAYDKFFVKALKEDPRLKSANFKGSKELEELVDETLHKLSYRQEILRAQRPYYAIKRSEKSQSSRLTKFKKELLVEDRRIGVKEVEKLLEDMRKCLIENRTMDLVLKGERLQRYLNSRTQRNMPELNYYTDQLYMLIGYGFLSQYRVSHNLNTVHNRIRALFLLGLPIGKQRVYDEVIANNPSHFKELNSQIQEKMEQLDICENAVMRCWLTFELARLENRRKNYGLSNFYALRCQKQADELTCHVWWINACFILMSSDLKQANFHEFEVHLSEAFARAMKIKQQEIISRLTAFLDVCATLAETNSHVTDRKAEMKREKDILDVLDDRTKSDAQLLFKRIQSLPPGRRFSVLPKMRPSGKNMTSSRQSARQTRSSPSYLGSTRPSDCQSCRMSWATNCLMLEVK